jgi:hypothetical protein
MGLARFMASPLGRGGRIVIGLALIGWGIGVHGGVLGWVLAIVGLLPLTLGIINGCLFGPLLHVPFRGADLPKA